MESGYKVVYRRGIVGARQCFCRKAYASGCIVRIGRMITCFANFSVMLTFEVKERYFHLQTI